MGLWEQLFVKDDSQIIGIADFSPKATLVSALLKEFKRKKRPLVINPGNNKKLPPSGTIIIGKSLPVVAEEIQQAVQNSTPVLIGKRIQHAQLQGFTLKEIKKLSKLIDTIPILMDMQPHDHPQHLVAPEDLDRWTKYPHWHHFLLSIPAEVFLDKLQDAGQQTITLDPVIDEQHGILPLFRQKWPAALVLTEIGDTRKENQLLVLIHEIKQQVPEIAVALYDSGNNTIEWVK